MLLTLFDRARNREIRVRSWRRSTTSEVSAATSVPAGRSDAEVGLRECRPVVDTIADHGDAVAVLLPGHDEGGLGLGRDVALAGRDARLTSDGRGRRCVVAGQERGLDAKTGQLGHRLRGRRVRLIANDEKPKNPRAGGDPDDRVSVVEGGVRRRGGDGSRSDTGEAGESARRRSPAREPGAHPVPPQRAVLVHIDVGVGARGPGTARATGCPERSSTTALARQSRRGPSTEAHREPARHPRPTWPPPSPSLSCRRRRA